MSSLPKEPSLIRGLFLFLLLLMMVLVHSGRLPFAYLGVHVSQQIFILLFLDLLMGYAVFCHGRKSLSINGIHLMVLLGLLMVVVTNYQDLLSCSVIAMYALILLLLQFLAGGRFLSLALSCTAVIVTSLSVYHYTGIRFGIFKPLYTVQLAGIYGQPNLFAAFMVIGLASYCQLILNTRQRLILHLIPVLIFSTVLFLTASRAAILGVLLSFLSITYLLYKNQGWLGKEKILVGIVFFVGLGCALASQIGEISTLERNMDKTVILEGSANTYERLNDWYSAYSMGADYFPFGAGVGSFKMLLGKYTVKTSETLRFTYDSISQTLWAHNDFLQVFAEVGLIPFLLLVIIFLAMVWHTCVHFSQEKIFPLFAILAFAIMMCFGHPFRYNALVFSFMCMVAVLLDDVKPLMRVDRKLYLLLFLLVMIFVNIVMVRHFIRAYDLGQFVKVMKGADEYDRESYFSAKEAYLVDAFDGSSYVWRLQHETYYKIANYIFKYDDREFARRILPEMLEYKKQNNFATYYYSLAQVYNVLDNYEESLKYSKEASERKPDYNLYFVFGHINLSMIISRDNGIPLGRLLGEDELEKMIERDFVKMRVLDAQGVVRIQTERDLGDD